MAEKQKKRKIVIIFMVTLLAILCGWTALDHQRTVRRMFAPLLPDFEATQPSGQDQDTTVVKGLTKAPFKGLTASPMDEPAVVTKDEPAVVTKKVDKRPILGYEVSTPSTGEKFSASNADISPLEKGNAITRERKKRLGIDKSLDLIVHPNEQFMIGKNRVSMKDILEKAAKATGNLFEEKINASGQTTVDEDGLYGIYVVRPGDNIWNIHFKFLREYFRHQGVTVEMTADEPLPGGLSSGVGKLLKFSEKMVIIYNLQTGDICSEINLLEPLSKIVVYNLHEIFSLLKEIDYKNVDNIRFDGNEIWIPAKHP